MVCLVVYNYPLLIRFCLGAAVEFRVFCRSDPTENDSVEGLRPNARGPGLVSFGVSVL